MTKWRKRFQNIYCVILNFCHSLFFPYSQDKKRAQYYKEEYTYVCSLLKNSLRDFSLSHRYSKTTYILLIFDLKEEEKNQNQN